MGKSRQHLPELAQAAVTQQESKLESVWPQSSSSQAMSLSFLCLAPHSQTFPEQISLQEAGEMYCFSSAWHLRETSVTAAPSKPSVTSKGLPHALRVPKSPPPAGRGGAVCVRAGGRPLRTHHGTGFGRIFRLWSRVPCLKGGTSWRGAAGPGGVRSRFCRTLAREEGYSRRALGAPPQALLWSSGLHFLKLPSVPRWFGFAPLLKNFCPGGCVQ